MTPAVADAFTGAMAADGAATGAVQTEVTAVTPLSLPFATDDCPRNVVEALVEHDWTSEAFKPIQLLATGKISQIFRALVLRSTPRWRKSQLEQVLDANKGSSGLGLPSEKTRKRNKSDGAGSFDAGNQLHDEEMVVVMKVYEKKRMGDIHHRNVRREIDIHRNHSGCIFTLPLFAAFEDTSCYYLVQREAVSGDLYRELRKGMIQAMTLNDQYDFSPSSRDPATGRPRPALNCLYANERRCAVEVIKPLLCLLVHLHRHGVIHRDIKPENILLSTWCEEDVALVEADTVEAKLTKGLICSTKSKSRSSVGGHGGGGAGGSGGDNRTHPLSSAFATPSSSSSPKQRGWNPFQSCGLSSPRAGKRYNKHLLLKSRKGWKIQLCDFGLAIDTTASIPVLRVGTVEYMAPEVLRCPTEADLKERAKVERLRSSLRQGNKGPSVLNTSHLSASCMNAVFGGGSSGKYDHRVDIWAVGVLLFELLVGRTPFGSQMDSEHTIEQNIIEGVMSFPKGVLSPLAKNFIQKALTYNRFDRPDAIDLLRHPWVTKYCGEIHLQLPQPKKQAAATVSHPGKPPKQPFGRLNSKHLDALLWKVI